MKTQINKIREGFSFLGLATEEARKKFSKLGELCMIPTHDEDYTMVSRTSDNTQVEGDNAELESNS